MKHAGIPEPKPYKGTETQCCAECYVGGRWGSWHQCRSKAKYTIDGLPVCGRHKNKILKTGTFREVTGKSNSWHKKTVSTEHHWPDLWKKQADEQKIAYEAKCKRQMEEHYRSCLYHIAEQHGLTTDELTALLPGRK